MAGREGSGQGPQGGRSRRKAWWMAAVTGVVLAAVGSAAWLHWEDNRWNSRAIAARFTDVTVQRQNERDVHLLLHYELTNATQRSYRLAPPTLGVLMQRVPGGALEEIDSVVWEPVGIPAGETVSAEFDITLPSTEDLTSPEEIRSEQDLKAFAGRELSHMRGLVFFDYGQRYWIELPKGWP